MEDKKRIQTAQQKLNNFLRSPLAKEYPLNGYVRAVLAALSSYFYYNPTCNPSIKSISDYCQFSEKEIRRSLKILQSLGLILIETSNGCRSVYTWNIPEISDEEIYRRKGVNKSGKSRDNSKSAVPQTGVTAVPQTGVDIKARSPRPTNMIYEKNNMKSI